MELLRINWQNAAELAEELAEKIDYIPEVLIGISRGGLVPVRIISDIKGIRHIGILGMGFYKSVGRTNKFPEIVQDVTTEIKGKNVLLVDDVADTGRSLMAAKDYILRKNAKQVKTATIHYKPISQIKPDYFVRTTNAWIIYPWERHEAERELKKH